MYKKEYQRPEEKVVLLESDDILVGSTGATGEDAPWAVKMSSYGEWDERTSYGEWDERTSNGVWDKVWGKE